MARVKVGFIVKSKINGKTIFNHLFSSEINLISKIAGESDNKEIEVKKVFFTDEDKFILTVFF